MNTFTLQEANKAFFWLAEKLNPCTVQLELSGDARRELPQITEVEMVAIPRNRAAMIEAIGTIALANSLEHTSQQLDFQIRCSKGSMRVRVHLASNADIDLIAGRIPSNFGAVQLASTGSRHFFNELVAYARAKGFTWQHPRGLYRNEKWVCETEQEIFEALGLNYVLAQDRKSGVIPSVFEARESGVAA